MRRLALLALPMLGLIGSAAASSQPSSTSNPATAPGVVTAVQAKPHPMTVRVYDASGRRGGTRSAIWTAAGGNCCEALLSATSTGRLLDLGGAEPFFSDDGGRSWSKVTIATPAPLAGEGALVAAPGGAVFGVMWAPYAGDHLQSIVYPAVAGGWGVGEVPLHTLLYDRPYLTYAQGPFTIHGLEVPFVTVVHGGALAGASSLLSTDGVAYAPAPIAQEVEGQSVVPYSIPVVVNPAADWWQPAPESYAVPLNAGSLLVLRNALDGFSCPAVRLVPQTGAWQCIRLPFAAVGTLRQDSRGWLTEVSDLGETSLRLRLSPDGGRHWRSVTLRPPGGGRIFERPGYDVKVNGRLGVAVVVSRFLDPATRRGQDLLWEVDVRSPQPRLLRSYEVGRGDDPADSSTSLDEGGGSADRIDFASVALLPDRRVAMSFLDLGTPPDGADEPVAGRSHAPAIAVFSLG